MAKASNSGNRNDARTSGKAAKKDPRVRGSKSVQLSELDKILMGKGLAVKYSRHNATEARRAPKKGKSSSEG